MFKRGEVVLYEGVEYVVINSTPAEVTIVPIGELGTLYRFGGDINSKELQKVTTTGKFLLDVRLWPTQGFLRWFGLRFPSRWYYSAKFNRWQRARPELQNAYYKKPEAAKAKIMREVRKGFSGRIIG